MVRVKPKIDFRHGDGTRYSKRAHIASEVLFEGKWSVQVLVPCGADRFVRTTGKASSRSFERRSSRNVCGGWKLIDLWPDMTSAISFFMWNMNCMECTKLPREVLDHLAKRAVNMSVQSTTSGTGRPGQISEET